MWPRLAVALLPPRGVSLLRRTGDGGGDRPPPLRVLRSPAATGPRLQLGDPPLEEAPLALRVCERERALERFARLTGPAEPAQQLPARRVQVLVVGELELLDDLERTFGVASLRHRHRVVQLHDRRARDLRELG